jgi:hypothetical protein
VAEQGRGIFEGGVAYKDMQAGAFDSGKLDILRGIGQILSQTGSLVPDFKQRFYTGMP